MPVRALALCLASLTASILPLSAQTASRLSLQVSGLFETFTSADGELFRSGPGIEAQLRYAPSAFSIGAGVYVVRHHHKVTEDDLNFTGVFVEPRVVIDAGSERVAPYVSARLSWANVGLDAPPDLSSSNGIAVEDISSGPALNGGGGLLVNLGGPILDVGVGYGLYKIDDQNMQNVVLRAGLAFGL